MKRKGIVAAFAVLGIAVLSAGGACTKAKPQEPGVGVAPTKAKTQDSGAGDFVEVRMRISGTPNDPATCDFEEVFRIAYPETAKAYSPATLPEGQGAVEVYGIHCAVVSLSRRSLSENQEKILNSMIRSFEFPFGMARSGKDPSLYYITFVGNPVG